MRSFELSSYGLAAVLLILAGLRVWGSETDSTRSAGARQAPPNTTPPAIAFTDPTTPPRRLFGLQSDAASNDFTGAIGHQSKAEDAAHLPTLVGVILREKDRLAIFNFNGKLERIHESGSIGTWTVTRIEARTVFLQSADQSHSISLDPPLKYEDEVTAK